MGNIISTTLNELDQLEQQYSIKNKRKSGNLRNRIGDHEKVIFCYYEIASVPNFFLIGTHPDILYHILTDIKLIFTANDIPDRVWEINLSDEFTMTLGVLGLGSGLWLNYPNGATQIFGNVKDKNFLNYISGAIQKAKANLAVRSRSSTININTPKAQNQETVADQLAKLAELHKSGVLTDDEFTRAKERVLSGTT